MSIVICHDCGAHVDSDFYEVYFHGDLPLCESCQIAFEADREAEELRGWLEGAEECIDCGEVNPRGHMQGACYMNCSKGAVR